jgi:antitoxin component YwqK of YwqJK toxin-antitoxin module
MEMREQFLIKHLFRLSLLAVLWSCLPEKVILSTDKDITFFQGKYYYKGELYNGIIKQYLSVMKETHLVPYKNGIEHGNYIAKNDDGQILEDRNFFEGEKHGIHKSFYSNGNFRLYSEFDHGNYNNERWEWHINGNPLLYEKFDKEGKLLVTKKWYQNGHIYMNVSYNETKTSFGLPGSKVCAPINKIQQ